MKSEPDKCIKNTVPLVVDLDGTLINADLLHIALKIILKRNFLYFFICIKWISGGRAYFKKKVFSIVYIDAALLPYNKDVVIFLYDEFNKGRKLILATASLELNAIDIAKVHPIFSEVYGTKNNINLKGKVKLQKLLMLFGKGRFDYIGNSMSDLIIFSHSRYAYLANPSKLVERRAKKLKNLIKIWK